MFVFHAHVVSQWESLHAVPGDQWLLCSAIQPAGLILRSEDPSLNFPPKRKMTHDSAEAHRLGRLLGHQMLDNFLFCFILSIGISLHSYPPYLLLSSTAAPPGDPAILEPTLQATAAFRFLVRMDMEQCRWQKQRIR